MSFLKTLRCDLEKTTMNLGFFGAVILTCILCFTASAYTDTATDKTYSVLEAFFSIDKELLRTNYSFSNVTLFSKALSGYITMFLPIIAAFPFMVSFCAERNSGLMRFTITRAGKIKYCASKFAASFLSGGLATLLGVMLYGIIIWIVFPDFSGYNVPQEQLMWVLPHGTGMTVIRTMLAAFLYGAVTTIPAFFISSFCKNPYLITCIPFLFVYIWDTALSKIAAKGLENMDYGIYDKIGPFFPYGLADIVNWTEWDFRITATILFNCVYFLMGFAGFFIIMNHRTDKGV